MTWVNCQRLPIEFLSFEKPPSLMMAHGEGKQRRAIACGRTGRSIIVALAAVLSAGHNLHDPSQANAAQEPPSRSAKLKRAQLLEL